MCVFTAYMDPFYLSLGTGLFLQSTLTKVKAVWALVGFHSVDGPFVFEFGSMYAVKTHQGPNSNKMGPDTL